MTSALCQLRPSASPMRASTSAGDQHLRAAQPEHRLAQHPQARGLQLQADDEQQQHHAQLGEVQDVVDLGDQPQRPRADDHAGGQIAEDRAQLEPAKHRDGDDGGGQENGGFGEKGHIGRGGTSAWHCRRVARAVGRRPGCLSAIAGMRRASDRQDDKRVERRARHSRDRGASNGTPPLSRGQGEGGGGPHAR